MEEENGRADTPLYGPLRPWQGASPGLPVLHHELKPRRGGAGCVVFWRLRCFLLRRPLRGSGNIFWISVPGAHFVRTRLAPAYPLVAVVGWWGHQPTTNTIPPEISESCGLVGTPAHNKHHSARNIRNLWAGETPAHNVGL